MAVIDEKEYTKSFDWKIWKRLGPVLSGYKKAFVGMFVFNVICALTDVLLPLFQQYAVAAFIQTEKLDGIWPFGICYFVVILMQSLCVVGFGQNSMQIEQLTSHPFFRLTYI